MNIENSFSSINLEDFNNQYAFGDMLKDARRHIRKGLKLIARELGVDKNTVRCWETGYYFPKEELLEKIAEAYGAEVNGLKKMLILSKEAHGKKIKEKRDGKKLV